MKPSDFRAPEAGRVIRTIHGFAAFVPAPLPPKIDYDALALPLSNADAALGELETVANRAVNEDAGPAVLFGELTEITADERAPHRAATVDDEHATAKSLESDNFGPIPMEQS